MTMLCPPLTPLGVSIVSCSRQTWPNGGWCHKAWLHVSWQWKETSVGSTDSDHEHWDHGGDFRMLNSHNISARVDGDPSRIQCPTTRQAMFSCLLLVRLVCAYLVLNLAQGSHFVLVAILGHNLWSSSVISQKTTATTEGEPGGSSDQIGWPQAPIMDCDETFNYVAPELQRCW